MTDELVYEDIENDEPVEGELVVYDGELRSQEGFDVEEIAFSNAQIMSPELLEAIDELKTGDVNPRYIQKKGGLDYISHPHATRTMNAVFGPHWEFQNLSYEVFEDGSVSARCSLKIKWFDTLSMGWSTREFIEIGSYVPGKNKEGEIYMAVADRVGAATSRGLLKCMFRAFGYGAFLYKRDHIPMTKSEAYKLILKYADRKLGLTPDEVVKAFKKAKYTQDDLLTKYDLGMQILRKAKEDKEDEK